MMWQTALLINKKISTKLDLARAKSPDQGLITLEILISMLVGFFFIILALQTVVSGIAFKVLAQKEFGGDRLIQEEIERLNDFASADNLALGANSDAACDGVWDSGDGTPDDGYSQALWNERVADTDTLTTSTATTITVDPSVVNNNNVVGRQLILVGTRNTNNPGGANSPQVLGINYVVTGDDEDGDGARDEIARRYVEVIPDEALECS